MCFFDMGKKETFSSRLLKKLRGGGNVDVRAVRKSAEPLESDIQQSCIRWFQHRYRQLWEDGMLFHIANEGIRLRGMGVRFKREGVVKGVADLCLSIPRHGFGALYIEMKRPSTYQSPEQKRWQRNTERHGNKYVVCRSVEEFAVEVNRYLRDF